MQEWISAGVTIALAIVGLAFLSVFMSRKSNSVGVIQALASGMGNDMGVAMSPVTGAQPQFNLGYPAPNDMGYGFGG